MPIDTYYRLAWLYMYIGMATVDKIALWDNIHPYKSVNNKDKCTLIRSIPGRMFFCVFCRPVVSLVRLTT